jgi:hypothetical protein
MSLETIERASDREKSHANHTSRSRSSGGGGGGGGSTVKPAEPM